jgi:hypothetical protein
MSDTPRTDAWKRVNDPIEDLHIFARQLERELNAAQERIKRLEQGGDEAFYVGNQYQRLQAWTQAKEAKP